MFHSATEFPGKLLAGWRGFARRRLSGLVLALAVEALLVLLLLTLGTSIAPRGEDRGATMVRFKAASQEEQAEREQQKDDEAKQSVSIKPQATPDEPLPQPSARPAPDMPTPPLIQLSPKEMAAADIAVLPAPTPPRAGPLRAAMGPVDTVGRAADSQRVSGSGPNGEPLYAASWYREPYPDELRGYLSTASGPGWGLIACRTVPDYRVEDCVAIDEWPSRSNIARAVLAAAWQFRVRPPRVGGQVKVGEWVRIRIDYDLRRPSGPAR